MVAAPPAAADWNVVVGIGIWSPSLSSTRCPARPRICGRASTFVSVLDSSSRMSAVGEVTYMSAALIPPLTVFMLNGGGEAGGNVPDVSGGDTSGENVKPSAH